MKKRKIKYIILLILIISISIGFAYLTSTLDIIGIGHLKKATWKIYFDNVNILEGETLSSNPPTTTNHNTTSVSYTVNMNKPGDVYKFNIDVVNNGTLDAMVSIIDENTILTTEQSKYASYSIKYLDGSPIEENNFLGKHSKETLQVIIKYKKDITSTDLPTEQMTLNFNLSLTYKQAKNADSRRGESTIITDLSGNGNDGVMYGGRVNADGSVYLDGVDDYIDCGLANYDFGNSISYVLRFKIHSLNSTDALTAVFGNWKDAGGGLYLVNGGSSSQYAFQIKSRNGNTYNNFNSTTNVTLDTWATLVGTFDGEYIKLYLNGTQINYQNGGPNLQLDDYIKVSTNTITIGALKSTNGRIAEFTNATIKDALVFDRALTAEEIATDYATTVNPTNTDDMVLRYNFSTNNIVKDLSGNNNNGTIYGATINSDGTISTDGIDDYVDCGLAGHNFGNSMSLIVRVKVNELTSHNNLVIGNWENGGGGIFYDTTHLQFDYTNSATSAYVRYLTDYEPTLNTWYTIVGTYDGQKYKLYQNGKEIPYRNTSDTYEQATTGNLISSSKFLLAANPEQNGININYSKITYSDVLIFDRAVTKQEVENDYAKTISPSNRQDLLLYYHFG